MHTRGRPHTLHRLASLWCSSVGGGRGPRWYPAMGGAELRRRRRLVMVPTLVMPGLSSPKT